MSATEVDEHGVEHRHGCHCPGWTVTPSRVRGVSIARCVECGCVELRTGGMGVALMGTPTREPVRGAPRAQPRLRISLGNASVGIPGLGRGGSDGE
jgi:hypothetical protein